MRRHDLDWLRVLVFGLLILYHVGMFFVPWGWHIKNNTLYEWLVYPMWFLNQWRLPMLFVISGMGTYFALGKRTGWQFSWERARRLYIPLAFGMLVVVPPQVYVERIAKGQFQGGFFDYYPWQAFVGIYPSGNVSWHHLWFLAYLLLFSLLLTPGFVYLRNHPGHAFWQWLRRIAKHPVGLYALAVPLYLIQAFLAPLFPTNMALVNDWYTLAYYLTLFFYGFALMGVRDTFWTTVLRFKPWYLGVGIAAFSCCVMIDTSSGFLAPLAKVVNVWAWLLVIFGYAAQYLNRPNSLLAYANEAVYPFYILHQTFTLVIGYQLMGLPWGLGPKFLLMVGFTFFSAWLVYELAIRRWAWVRPLFGMKKLVRQHPAGR